MTTTLDPYRLPTTVRPSAYRLRIATDLETHRFEGTAEIDVELDEPMAEIVLNAIELELEPATLDGGGAAQTSGAPSIDVERERATFSFPTTIPAGPHTLSIGFAGTLSDQLVGFYRATFTDDEGVEHRLASTQFEATDARRAFPCFDEPSLKATFDLTLVAAEGLGVYANTPVVSESSLGPGRREVVFARTMKMSTYLVAYVVGPFAATPVVDVDGVPLSVVCRPSQAHLAGFALEVGAFSLRFFKEYFGIPYPGLKVDLVGIPDFAYGAMENVGCVTFREQALLVDIATASQDELVGVANVIAHELAHMWFGDLVTMAWWEGIWLNEAFATYMSFVCCDAFRPEWKMWVRFSLQRETGLMIDALHTTRAIEFEVKSPGQAAEMADFITYQKGASVLRMLEQYLGEAVYRDGIRRYLATHAYANTVTSDLWAALEAASGEPVGEIMNTWILQGGHPVVTVGDETLSQRPFMFAPPEGRSAIGSDWIVPVLARSLDDGRTSRTLLSGREGALPVSQPAFVNAGGAGTYRTSYEPTQLTGVAARLPELSEVERTVLLGDTWALARAGERTIADVLTLVAGLGIEPEPSVWQVVDNLMDFLDRTVPEPLRPALEARTRSLLGPTFEHFGWEPHGGEDPRAQQVRATLIRRLGTTGADEKVRTESASRFDAGEVDGDLAAAVLAVVASMSRPGDYDELLRRCDAAPDPQSADRYRTALAGVPDEALCVRTFERAFEIFKLQDAVPAIMRLVANPVGGTAVWSALADSWDETIAKVPPLMQFYLGIGLLFVVPDEAFLARATAFHRDHPLPSGQQEIERALERMASSLALAARERPRLAETLAQRAGPTG